MKLLSLEKCILRKRVFLYTDFVWCFAVIFLISTKIADPFSSNLTNTKKIHRDNFQLFVQVQLLHCDLVLNEFGRPRTV